MYKIIKKDGQSSIEPVQITTLEKEGLYEVKDLSRWIAATPGLLSHERNSPPPLVLGCEVTIATDMRVDLLALDRDGTIVTVEVKRNDQDPLYQGLRYSGRLFSMPTDDLIKIAENATGKDVSQLQTALDNVDEWSIRELWEAGRRSIRLVIVAQDYSPDVFQSARWLVATGTRISCIRFECLRDAGNLYLSSEQILPSVETAENYAVQREAAQREAKGRTRNMFYPLILSGQLTPGESVYSSPESTEIGIVRDNHIERLSDNSKCVNLYQLIGVSWSAKAAVKRGERLITFADLGGPQPSAPLENPDSPSVP